MRSERKKHCRMLSVILIAFLGWGSGVQGTVPDKLAKEKNSHSEFQLSFSKQQTLELPESSLNKESSKKTTEVIRPYNYQPMEKKSSLSDAEKLALVKLSEKKDVQLTADQSFQLAEMHFEESGLRRARDLYAATIWESDNKNRLYAMYKRACAFFYSGDRKNSLIGMKQALRASLEQFRSVKEKGGVPGKELLQQIRAAREGLVYFFSEISDQEKAFSYFLSVDKRSEAGNLLEILYELYREKNEIEKSKYIARQLLQKFPKSKRAPYFAEEIIEDSNGWEHPEDYQRKLLSWINTYGAGTEWAKKYPGKFLQVSVAQEEKLRVWILHQQLLMKKSIQEESLAKIFDLYELYMKNFPQSKNSGQLRLLYGDMFYNLKKYQEAASQYVGGIEVDPHSDRVKQRYLGAILAREKQLPLRKDVLKVAENSLKEVPYFIETKPFIEVTEEYLKKFPEADENLQIRYKLAKEYLMYNRFSHSEKTFLEVMERYPKTQLASFSEELAAESLFKNIVRGDQSAPAFLAFTKKYPKSPLLGHAYFNAAVAFHKENDWNRAIANYDKAIEKEKGATYGDQAHRALAQIFEKTGRYRQAVEELELIAGKLSKKDKQRGDYLNQAGVIWEALENIPKAIESFEILLVEHPKNKKLALEKLAGLYREKKNFEEANNYLYSLIENYPEDIELCRWSKEAADNEKKRGRAELSQQMIDRAEKCLGRLKKNESESVKTIKAELKFERSLEYYAQLVKAPEKGDLEKGIQALSEKMKNLEKMDLLLREVIALDLKKYTISSLTVASEAYRYMSGFIQALIAKGSVTQKEKYRDELVNIGVKMKENSKIYARLSVEKAKVFQWTTSWLERVAKNTSVFGEYRVQMGLTDDF